MSMSDNPALLNYIIMSLYCMSAGWWALHGRYVDSLYWCSALFITAVVTFGYRH